MRLVCIRLCVYVPGKDEGRKFQEGQEAGNKVATGMEEYTQTAAEGQMAVV